jgi:hypothetical protein
MSSGLKRGLALGLLVSLFAGGLRSARAEEAPAPPPESAAPPAGSAAPSPGTAAPPLTPSWPPQGYEPPQITMVHRKRHGLIAAGAITFGISWGLMASISSILLRGSDSSCSETCRESAKLILIPFVGPYLGDAHSSGGRVNPIAIGWGVVELVGATMLVLGFVGHDVPAKPAVRTAQRGPTLDLAPMLARDAGGMTLTARW